ncbi:MAG: hypothetical protein M3Q64_00440 [bacterium]|nr:hypothetical protein [bacterium]
MSKKTLGKLPRINLDVNSPEYKRKMNEAMMENKVKHRALVTISKISEQFPKLSQPNTAIALKDGTFIPLGKWKIQSVHTGGNEVTLTLIQMWLQVGSQTITDLHNISFTNEVAETYGPAYRLPWIETMRFTIAETPSSGGWATGVADYFSSEELKKLQEHLKTHLNQFESPYLYSKYME